MTFSGTSSGKNYVAEINFFKEVDPAKSKYAVKPRSIEFVLAKKESGPYWDHLLKEKGKPRWLKVDWDKWKDEDDVDEETGGFDMAGMNDFNFDMGAEEDDDSDDEDIPGLEEEPKKKEDEEEEKKTTTQ
eukprot:TRINITY_DN1866_c0_g1_i1.p1 TRINITY_DN1866_c0_g1~~TRINITY_DN1866_c0_g1_i1.p1  ORF type:complete len:130 (+),score=74.24 TRINITY_DN1866_c0_g1_i1:287-676(+)